VADTNLGNSIRLNQTSRVDYQYGPLGAEGSFVTVLESNRDEQCQAVQQYCVQTSIGNVNLPDGSDRHLAIVGKLKWGIGGVTFQADFDWKVGGQLSFAASFFRVDAAFSQTGDAAPDVVDIGAMYASGGRAARSQVTRTYPRLLLTAEAPTVVFPIPPFAHALYLFANEETFYGDDGDTPPIPNVSVRYVGGADNGFSAASTDLESFNVGAGLFKDALTNEDGVRFPESARFVEVTANDGEQYRFTPCFTLNF
jgi:hypothetical protein